SRRPTRVINAPAKKLGDGAGPGLSLGVLAGLPASELPGEVELFDALPVAAAACDLAGRLLRVNPAFAQLFGSPAQAAGGHLRELVDDRTRRELPALAAAALTAATLGRGEPVELAGLGVRADRTPFGVVLSARAVLIERPGVDLDSGGPAGPAGLLLVVARPQLEELRNAERLRRSEGRFAALADGAPVGVLGSESGMRADFANRCAAELYGVAGEELLGFGWLDRLEPGDADHAAASVEAALAGGAPAPATLRVVRPDGSRRWVRAQIAPGGNGRGEVGFVASLQDMTENRQLNHQLDHRARHDALTGLLNRDMIAERLASHLGRARSGVSRPAVLLLDLDNFKDVNECLGHRAGDRLLCTVATRLRECCRPSDVIGRFGGDEFVVVVPDSPSEAAACAQARRVADALAEPVELDGRRTVVTASVGVVWVDAGRAAEATPEDVLADADVAMYQAKQAGKNRPAAFDEEARAAVQRRMRVSAALRQAVEQGELDIHYQPISDLADGALVGFEALVRWNDPELGVVSPDQFIPAAEDHGLIAALGHTMLVRALADLAVWRRLPGRSGLYMNVNMSLRELDDQSVAYEIATALGQADLPASALCIELTESAVMRRPGVALARLDALKRLGVRLAIDDFGTGYSSLAHLKRLPVDVLKIDKAFVGGLGVDQESAPIIEAIVALAKALRLKTAVEGVETAEQLAELRRLGADYGQGYFIGRPLAAEHVAELLASRT
ncbi:MAG: putative bifunctional diguanylate cyclase/phosphodiesterase, partial [Acidimicrobiales bacterium]